MGDREISEKSAQRIEKAIGELKNLRDRLGTLSKDGIDAVVTPHGAVLVGDAQSVVTSSEARYRHIINRMSALVVELTLTGKIVYLNDAITTITGYSPGDLMGKSVV